MSPKPSPIYVYRCSSWRVVTTKELLPGDIISLSYKKQQRSKLSKTITTTPSSTSTGTPSSTASATTATSGNNSSSTTAADVDSNNNKGLSLTSRDDIIPCDCLLLKGKAVVNEASLTGMIVMTMVIVI